MRALLRAALLLADQARLKHLGLNLTDWQHASCSGVHGVCKLLVVGNG